MKPMLPSKSRGIPRVDDRRILTGIFWVLRSGAPWPDLPENYEPHTTCYSRFVRWRPAGSLLNPAALSQASIGSVGTLQAMSLVWFGSETPLMDSRRK